MDELVEIDYELSQRTAVCIVLPTRGEPLNVLREVILNAMSLNLWPGRLDVRKNARLVVIDDRRRAEVLLLIALCYRFAALFCNNRKVSRGGRGERRGLDGLGSRIFSRCSTFYNINRCASNSRWKGAPP
jgi:hypothetical protein